MLETRPDSDGTVVVRRRRCERCGVRATTIEQVTGGPVASAVVPRVRSGVPRAQGVASGKLPVPSVNNAEGLKAKAAARRRLEEIRDLHEAEEASEVMSMDEMRRELGW